MNKIKDKCETDLKHVAVMQTTNARNHWCNIVILQDSSVSYTEIIQSEDDIELYQNITRLHQQWSILILLFHTWEV